MDLESYFQYGEREIEYLKSADKKLGEIIDQVGMIKRTVIPDLFTALVYSITGQQISTKAHKTVWKRIQILVGEISPDNIDSFSDEVLQQSGISFRKVGYIKSIARKIVDGDLDLNRLNFLSDQEVCKKLCELDGVGQWTAEMLMIFSMQRPNVLSYGDLAIQRGLRMIYNHREIDKALFHKYWKRYSPYASVAGLYIWAVASGAIIRSENS